MGPSQILGAGGHSGGWSNLTPNDLLVVILDDSKDFPLVVAGNPKGRSGGEPSAAAKLADGGIDDVGADFDLVGVCPILRAT